MKRLKEYISEALSEDIKKLVKRSKEAKKSEEDDKTQPFTLSKQEFKNITSAKKPLSFDDINGDTDLKDAIFDKECGFAVANQIIKNPKKFFKDDEKINPVCELYFYSGKDNNSGNALIGICMHDDNIQYIENYSHIVLVETTKTIQNTKDVNKAIFDLYVETVSNSEILGLTTKAVNPKQKATLLKLGFKQTKENKEILAYIFK